MIVINKTKKIITFVVNSGKEGYDKVILKIGANVVDEKKFKKLNEVDVFKERLNKGLFLLKADILEKETDKESKKIAQEIKDEEKKKGASEDLSGFNVSEAKEIINETYDIELLKKWEDSEGRVSVQSAVKKRMEELLKEDK